MPVMPPYCAIISGHFRVRSSPSFNDVTNKVLRSEKFDCRETTIKSTIVSYLERTISQIKHDKRILIKWTTFMNTADNKDVHSRKTYIWQFLISTFDFRFLIELIVCSFQHCLCLHILFGWHACSCRPDTPQPLGGLKTDWEHYGNWTCWL